MYSNYHDAYKELETSPEEEAKAAREVAECLNGPIVAPKDPLGDPRYVNTLL